MQDLSLSSVTKVLSNIEEVRFDCWNNRDIETPFQIKPNNFLKFADSDLHSTYEHHFVNALSNIKRAIDCQVDSLLFGFALFEESKKRFANFPQKIEVLNSLGIISPRILQKVNKKRNLLEHEYVKPVDDDVEDAYDIATLFIVYTDKFLFKALVECNVINKKQDENIEFVLDYRAKKLALFNEVWENKEIIKKPLVELTPDLKEYIDYLKLFLTLYKL
jgi:hypothetical protein